jgi:hypothetical protein
LGGDPTAVLDNMNNTISGAGQVGHGQLTLHNEGTIAATGTNALVIDTGANVIVNTGLLEATGTGGLVVDSAVAGDPATPGSDKADIGLGSSIEFAKASDAAVSFENGANGAAGTLKLDQSTTGAFTGTLTGFSGYAVVDLADLMGGTVENFVASNSGNAPAGGMLTVGNGTQTVSLALLGQYAAASDFATTSDGHGGTIVTLSDPTVIHLAVAHG